MKLWLLSLLVIGLLFSFIIGGTVGKVLTDVVIFTLLLIIVRNTLLAYSLAKVPRGLGWRASTVLNVIWLVFPAFLLALATSGSNGSTALPFIAAGSSSDASFIFGVLCWVGIVALVVFVPSEMRARGVPWREDSPVPGWLACMSAVMSGVYVIIQHFAGGPLATSRLGVLCVAAFGVAALLAPFYRALVIACWRSAAIEIFDPMQWWRAWCVAWKEISKNGSSPAIGRSQHVVIPAPKPDNVDGQNSGTEPGVEVDEPNTLTLQKMSDSKSAVQGTRSLTWLR